MVGVIIGKLEKNRKEKNRGNFLIAILRISYSIFIISIIEIFILYNKRLSGYDSCLKII
jgi:hypothetical protein